MEGPPGETLGAIQVVHKNHYGKGDATEDVDGLDAGNGRFSGSVDRDAPGPGKVVVLTIPRTVGTAEKSICAPAFLQASPGEMAGLWAAAFALSVAWPKRFKALILHRGQNFSYNFSAYSATVFVVESAQGGLLIWRQKNRSNPQRIRRLDARQSAASTPELQRKSLADLKRQTTTLEGSYWQNNAKVGPVITVGGHANTPTLI